MEKGNIDLSDGEIDFVWSDYSHDSPFVHWSIPYTWRSDLYKQEFEYHDAKWLEEFPYTCVSLSSREPGKKKGDFGYGVKIDGTINAEEPEELLCNLYKERTGKELWAMNEGIIKVFEGLPICLRVCHEGQA